MIQRAFYLSVLFVHLVVMAGAQPIVNHFMAVQPDISRGRAFKSITENSEVLIRGIKPIPHKTEKLFNAHGLIIKQIAYNSAGGKTGETSWEYTSFGKLMRKHYRFFANLSGWNEEEVVVEWDSLTNLPTKVDVFKNGKKSQWAALVIDTLGRIESAKVFGSTGGHTFTEKFIYIEPSNMVKVMVYRANGVYTSSWSYPLDQQKDFTFESVSCSYYPNGDVMLEKLSDASKGDQGYYYEYEYDSQGNWVEKRTYQVNLGRNDKIKKKTLEHKLVRSIQYH